MVTVNPGDRLNVAWPVMNDGTQDGSVRVSMSVVGRVQVTEQEHSVSPATVRINVAASWVSDLEPGEYSGFAFLTGLWPGATLSEEFAFDIDVPGPPPVVEAGEVSITDPTAGDTYSSPSGERIDLRALGHDSNGADISNLIVWWASLNGDAFIRWGDGATTFIIPGAGFTDVTMVARLSLGGVDLEDRLFITVV